MDISPSEAEENLAAIQAVMQKTRHAIASSGTYVTLIVTGIVWLIGFVSTQFLPGEVVGYVWTGLSIFGTILGTVWGFRMGRRVRSPSMAGMARRAGLYWLFLVFFCIVTIAVAWPLDGKQVTVLIVLFAMIGHLAMGLLLSFAAVWWPLPITALVLISYFLLPDLFYLWMGILGGGGMIALGFYIRHKW
jgi:uncharacterized membrane protein